MSVAISVEGLTVRFGDVTALDNVGFSVEAGEFVAIIGPNGAGKSTLLDVLLGVQKMESGTVKVEGLDKVGYIPQRKDLDKRFPAKAIELVVCGAMGFWPLVKRKGFEERALRAMKRVGVDHCAEQQISTLSGGELQRVYLAKSLVRDPSLLILDEPAAGMDLAGEADMYHLLLDYQKDYGATVVMITHDWEGARVHADKVLLLNKKVIAFGDAKDVMDEARLLHLFHHRGHVGESHDKEHYHD